MTAIDTISLTPPRVSPASEDSGSDTCSAPDPTALGESTGRLVGREVSSQLSNTIAIATIWLLFFPLMVGGRIMTAVW